jgi:nitrile hydratase subunit beta
MNALPPLPGRALPVGTSIIIRKQPPEIHCRTPFYLRGVKGEIAEVRGRFRDPSLLAFHKPGLPMRVLYRVRFKQKDVWPEYKGGPNDTVVADIFEHWIDPIVGVTKA